MHEDNLRAHCLVIALRAVDARPLRLAQLRPPRLSLCGHAVEGVRLTGARACAYVSEQDKTEDETLKPKCRKKPGLRTERSPRNTPWTY